MAKAAGHDNLTSIKGIGDYSAAALLSMIGDVGDFSDEDKLASYFGIVPRVADSRAELSITRLPDHLSLL